MELRNLLKDVRSLPNICATFPLWPRTARTPSRVSADCSPRGLAPLLSTSTFALLDELLLRAFRYETPGATAVRSGTRGRQPPLPSSEPIVVRSQSSSARLVARAMVRMPRRKGSSSSSARSGRSPS